MSNQTNYALDYLQLEMLQYWLSGLLRPGHYIIEDRDSV